jgi:hypothetical protein
VSSKNAYVTTAQEIEKKNIENQFENVAHPTKQQGILDDNAKKL